MKNTQSAIQCEVKTNGTAKGDGHFLPLLDTLEITVDKGPIEDHARRKRRGLEVAKQLENAGFYERARKIRQCCQMSFLRRYSCGHESQTRQGQGTLFFRCKDKLCPNCNHVRSVKLSKRLGPALEAYAKLKGLHVYHLTLTFVNTWSLPDYKKIRTQAKRLFDSESIARKAFWDRYGYHGAVMNFEVTIAEDGRFHPHFHILLFTEHPIELIETGKHAGDWQNRVNQELSDLWLKITKDSPILKGRSFEFSGMFEMVKYLTKGVYAMPDEQFAELAEWSNGKRFISLLGELYNSDELKKLIEEQDIDDSECCPECGCNEFIDVPVRFDLCTGRYVESYGWITTLKLPLSPS